MSGSGSKRLGDILGEVKRTLKASCTEDGEDCSKISILLVSQMLGMDKTKVVVEKDLTIEEEDYQRIIYAALKYAAGYPLQYCTNRAYFMGLEFYVDENVLIPRFDTETLIEVAIEIFEGKENLLFLDMGTGSGCIAVALCKFLPCRVVAVDISEDAIKIARKNAKLNNVENKIEFIKSDLFENIPSSYRFDAIISNPPYVSEKQISDLDRRVLKEPRIALFSGEDGLWHFKQIAKNAGLYLKNGGYIILEVGYNQAKSVKSILQSLGYKNIDSKNDLSNIERCVYARWELSNISQG
ncbi:peptide chain release factor N(5)-glutamine methyltransferase [Caldicellulosiruptor morganii]|uniref:Release factor glutamine methyltransferase n=1 Tax=Caldicellulosiruptor morganii TaxID=1387555 RepID=A0ABY7BQ79_9FIRM|nr:peptide chain release factor N(5)-glutamine methyltransferase [Caldicellulosiruptor morganii]WAM33166.1 peptide chain release factor N(5)-glutamine methyltransferase [Caldicellulosiruptor morganii]